MPFPARAYRLLIASPGDVKRERELAVQAIQHWNDLNSADRQVVLLPLRWETHSAPEYGLRPQAVINRQVADPADIVVGVFWTRIGTPTGEADSGTIEEIERAANAGKLVMLYFSSAPQDPDSIDLDQLGKLREFKSKTWPNALVSSYSDPSDFRDKFLKQLDIQVRRLISEQQDSVDPGEIPLAITNIDLQLADVAAGTPIGLEKRVETKYLRIDDFSDIPDFVDPNAKEEKTGVEGLLDFGGVNKDFYRQKAVQVTIKNFFVPIRWWLKNRGGVGARDVYVDLSIATDEDVLSLVKASDILKGEPSKQRMVIYAGAGSWPSSPESLMSLQSRWRTSIDLRALQPQREIATEAELYLGATKSCTVMVYATIYADTLSAPKNVELRINFDVESVISSAEDFVNSLRRITRRRVRVEDKAPIE